MGQYRPLFFDNICFLHPYAALTLLAIIFQNFPPKLNEIILQWG